MECPLWTKSVLDEWREQVSWEADSHSGRDKKHIAHCDVGKRQLQVQAARVWKGQPEKARECFLEKD